ncbi:MAG: hypothetical protein O3A53_15700 [Acidobacteria bacterium]|nr:hypothetical protein [Acidobacteriota bacterium]MDA1236231.1 hypothetical protein [Acidobacteriota bacterium]
MNRFLRFASVLPYCVALSAALLNTPVASGQKIAYSSQRDGLFELIVMNADGSEQTNLTNGAFGNIRDPQWSPDGSKILFYSDRDGGDLEVYVTDADGANQTRLTESPGSDSGARWSPDGSRIAFTSRRSTPLGDIYAMNSDGSDLVRLTEASWYAVTPRWSPNGQKILFEQGKADESGSDVYVMNADGSGQTNLTNSSGSDSLYEWSPDSSKIVFTSTRTGVRQVYVMNADGSGLIQVTDEPSVYLWPSWAPDGTRIVFEQDSDVWIANPDGSSLLNVTNVGLFAQRRPAWTPDGSRIHFTRQDEIYVVKPDGSEPKNLTNFVGRDWDFHAFGDFSELEPPAISAGGDILANLAPKLTTVSPRSIVSVFGVGFSSESTLFPQLDSQGRIATVMDGNCIEVAGERAPIYALTPNQANIQIPATTPLGPVSVVFVRNCGTLAFSRSEVEMVTVEQATPGFFLYSPIAPAGRIAARFNEDSVIVAGAGALTDEFGPSRPAQIGDIILLFGTGWGETEAALDTGELAVGAAQVLPAANGQVTFGGIPLAPEDVLYVGVTPGAAGLFQLAIRVPQTTTAGNKRVALTVYGKSTPNGPVVPVAAP